MKPVIKQFKLGNSTITLETGRIARQATGAVLVSIDDAVSVLVTVVAAKQADNAWQVPLNNAELTFTELDDDRGPGLSGIHLRVLDKAGIQTDAANRGCAVTDSSVTVAGVHWHLHA